MKKGTSYIVVAAMMMGLMLTGCGGNDNSGTSVAEATTDAETEAAIDDEDTDTQDTTDESDDTFEDDTEDASDEDTEDASDEDTEDASDDSDEAEVDSSLVGLYTENGYQNEYFGFQVTLDENYTIYTRGSATSVSDISEVVDDSNSDEAISTAMANVDDVTAANSSYDFYANDGTHFIQIRIKSPKGGGNIGYDTWADEESIVTAGCKDLEDVVKTTASQAGLTVDDVETDYSECEIFGEKHYMAIAKTQLQDQDYVLVNVVVRSADGKYEATIVIETLGDANYQDIIDNCFSPL